MTDYNKHPDFVITDKITELLDVGARAEADALREAWSNAQMKLADSGKQICLSGLIANAEAYIR